MYRPIWLQWTWFGVNRPDGCWVLVSAMFQEPLLCPWACPCCPDGQMTMKLHIHRQNGSNALNLELIRLVFAELRQVPRELIMPMGMPMWPQWANDQTVVHLHAKMVPMNLIWRESAQVLLSSCVPVMPIWARWANSHDAAHVQAQAVPMNLIWSESAQ